jgi:S1-C subfamily serine protease
VSGAIARALNVPQPGGFLVKQVVNDSVASRLGIKGGNRIGIVEGQQIVVGGDILLSVQGITMASAADRAQVFKAPRDPQGGRRPARDRRSRGCR